MQGTKRIHHCQDALRLPERQESWTLGLEFKIWRSERPGVFWASYTEVIIKPEALKSVGLGLRGHQTQPPKRPLMQHLWYLIVGMFVY